MNDEIKMRGIYRVGGARAKRVERAIGDGVENVAAIGGKKRFASGKGSQTKHGGKHFCSTKTGTAQVSFCLPGLI